MKIGLFAAALIAAVGPMEAYGVSPMRSDYPSRSQSPEEAKMMLDKAQAKRDRKAAKLLKGKHNAK